MSFSVTYDANGATGGTVPIDSHSYSTGDEVTVLDNTGNLVKFSDTFARWNTKPDGTGAAYGPLTGWKFTMDAANVKLYAQWYTKAGLIDIGEGPGVTEHFTFFYESSLQGTGLEPMRTNVL